MELAGIYGAGIHCLRRYPRAGGRWSGQVSAHPQIVADGYFLPRRDQRLHDGGIRNYVGTFAGGDILPGIALPAGEEIVRSCSGCAAHGPRFCRHPWRSIGLCLGASAQYFCGGRGLYRSSLADEFSVAASFLMHCGYNLALFAALWIASDHYRHLEKVTG